MDAVERYLESIQNEMGFMGFVQNIPVFDGNSKDFKEWYKAVDRARVILGGNPRTGVRLALATSKKAVADYVSRFYNGNPQQPNWEHFSEQLLARFGETLDQATALAKLRKMKRKPGESIQVFAERLFSMGENAYDQALLANPVVQRELCQTFLTGCNEPRVAKAILKCSQAPQTLEQCVNIGVRELSLHNRFRNLGLIPDRDNNSHRQNEPDEPMDLDMIRLKAAASAPPVAPSQPPPPVPPPPPTTIVHNYIQPPAEPANADYDQTPEYDYEYE